MVTFSLGWKDSIELKAESAQTIELLMTKKEWDAWYPPASSLYLLKHLFCYSFFSHSVHLVKEQDSEDT